jgi:drug/metabolite transporter (DMT)-like permease
LGTGGFFIRGTSYLIAGVLGTGVFATGAAFALLSWAQHHVSASRTAVICATEPLFAALAAFLLLGEELGGAPLGGGAIIIASIILSSVEETPKLTALLRRLFCCDGSSYKASPVVGDGTAPCSAERADADTL